LFNYGFDVGSDLTLSKCVTHANRRASTFFALGVFVSDIILLPTTKSLIRIIHLGIIFIA